MALCPSVIIYAHLITVKQRIRHYSVAMGAHAGYHRYPTMLCLEGLNQAEIRVTVMTSIL